MKVILNKDVSPLGEEGDVKVVAKGYARNYLFPRGFALPYTDKTIKMFETRRAEIEARKAEKRKDAAGLKERLEGTELTIVMPAGANGKLYGAVTNQTIMDELTKKGFNVERKRIELPGNHLKSVGKFKFAIKLYENSVAEVSVSIQAQVVKSEQKSDSHKGHPRQSRNAAPAAEAASAQESAPAETGASQDASKADGE